MYFEHLCCRYRTTHSSPAMHPQNLAVARYQIRKTRDGRQVTRSDRRIALPIYLNENDCLGNNNGEKEEIPRLEADCTEGRKL